MNNLEIYNKARQCPQTAVTPIQAGKLMGKSNINPQWRIEKLTEVFGPAGFGWYTETVRTWTDTVADETLVSVQVNLFWKHPETGEWSKPVCGIGGSKLFGKGKGKDLDDEAFKMAETDAISVCCKKLGFAADIYWQYDRNKYNTQQLEPRRNPSAPIAAETQAAGAAKQYLDITSPEWEKIVAKAKARGLTAVALTQYYDMSQETITLLQDAINKPNYPYPNIQPL